METANIVLYCSCLVLFNVSHDGTHHVTVSVTNVKTQVAHLTHAIDTILPPACNRKVRMIWIPKYQAVTVVLHSRTRQTRHVRTCYCSKGDRIREDEMSGTRNTDGEDEKQMQSVTRQSFVMGSRVD